MSFEWQVDKMGAGFRRPPVSPIINSSPAKLSKTIETATAAQVAPAQGC